MVNLTEQEKASFFADSKQNPLRITVYDCSPGGELYSPIHIIDESEILLESARYEEGLMDSTLFEFGSFVLPQLNIQWIFNGERYKGKKCKVYQVIGNSALVYFDGFIDEETFSKDMKTISAVIRPSLYYVMDRDISEYYNNAFDVYPQISMYTFLKHLNETLFLDKDLGVALNLDDLDLKFPIIKDFVFGKKRNVKRMPFGEFLKFLGEIIGANFRIKKYKSPLDYASTQVLDHKYMQNAIEYLRFDGKEIKFTYPDQNLFPSAGLYPLTQSDIINPTFELPYYINLVFDNQAKVNFDAFEIIYIDSNGERDSFIGYPGDTRKYYYVMDSTKFNNAFGDPFTGLGGDWDHTPYLDYLWNDVMMYALRLNYICATLDSPYAPFLEGGDNIKVTTPNMETVLIPILSVSSSGIYSAKSTIESNTRVN